MKFTTSASVDSVARRVVHRVHSQLRNDAQHAMKGSKMSEEVCGRKASCEECGPSRASSESSTPRPGTCNPFRRT
jgi:hypothetical protein